MLAVFGRLGSVEAAAQALPPPDEFFSYSFEYEEKANRRTERYYVKESGEPWAAIEDRYFAALHAAAAAQAAE